MATVDPNRNACPICQTLVGITHIRKSHTYFVRCSRCGFGTEDFDAPHKAEKAWYKVRYEKVEEMFGP